eukprot:10755994-Alexandrium_andersonii.AAC.1
MNLYYGDIYYHVDDDDNDDDDAERTAFSSTSSLYRQCCAWRLLERSGSTRHGPASLSSCTDAMASKRTHTKAAYTGPGPKR